jgi:hypothetical protein
VDVLGELPVLGDGVTRLEALPVRGDRFFSLGRGAITLAPWATRAYAARSIVVGMPRTTALARGGYTSIKASKTAHSTKTGYRLREPCAPSSGVRVRASAPDRCGIVALLRRAGLTNPLLADPTSSKGNLPT